MTFVAFHASADRAELVTDSWWYTPNAARIGNTTKTVTFAHLQTMYLVHGCAGFARAWAGPAQDLADHAAGFDEFVDAAPAMLRDTGHQLDAAVSLSHVTHGTAEQCGRANVFALGYCSALRRYRAVGFSETLGFRPFDIEGMFVLPSPFDVRPSPLEARSIKRATAKFPHPDDAAQLTAWQGRPAPEVPADPDGWLPLLGRVRQDRTFATLGSRVKVLIGGIAWYTALEGGAVLQVPLATFDDTAEDLARILGGTMHPIGQLAPCDCGSGVDQLHCCIPAEADEPCRCGATGRSTRECCMLDDAQAAEWAERIAAGDVTV